MGIPGNEKADRAAKAALSLPPVDFKLHFTDFKPLILQFVTAQWQTEWSNYPDNKLHSIKPTIGEWPPCYRDNRRDEVVLARLRTGHTYLTNSYLLKSEDQPQCIACDEPFTVKHILLDCIDLLPTRELFYRNVTSLKTLFETVQIHKIFDYLKHVGLYYKM